MKAILPLAVAQRWATHFLELLAPCCKRIEIAGSVRRERDFVGDIELVAIPRTSHNLFGDVVEETTLNMTLDNLVKADHLERLKNGDRYKQFSIVNAGCNLDLFIVSAETWGVQMLLRTGPAEFSKRFVTQKIYGGLMPFGWRVRDGRLTNGDGQLLDTPEEVDCFRAVGRKFVEPKDRE